MLVSTCSYLTGTGNCTIHLGVPGRTSPAPPSLLSTWILPKTVIKIFDSESNELIRQFPSEEILSIAQRIIELQQDISQKTGILLDENI